MKKIFAVMMMLSVHAQASMTKFMIDQGIASFESGQFESVGVDRNGFVSLSPQLHELFQESDILNVWAAAEDREGNLYFGTGNKARVYRYAPSGERTLLQSFEKGVSVNSLVVDSKGAVYAAVNPGQTLYKLSKDTVTEIPLPSQYIWKLIKDAHDNIYIAGGNPAGIYKLNPDGVLQELYLSKTEAHFLALALSGDTLYFASEGKGIVYQHQTSTQKTSVLFDSPEDEIKDMVLDEEGFVYIATATKTPKKLPQTFDYTDSFVLYGSQQKEEPPADNMKQNKEKKKHLLKNSIYKIDAQGKVEKLFTKDDCLFQSLAIDKNKQIYVGTGETGFIYKIRGINDAIVFTDTTEEHILSLTLTSKNTLIATSSGVGKVMELSLEKLSEGRYTSKVFDAQGPAQWGALSWQADDVDKGALQIFTRYGNTDTPDVTWTDWKTDTPLQKDDVYTSTVDSQGHQFVQYKAEFRSIDGELSPVLKRVYLAYLNENRPPLLEQITLNYSADKEIDKENPFYKVVAPIFYSLQWKSSDPDNDFLTHSIYFKEIHHRDWALLADGITTNSYVFDSLLIPDGQYIFKVLASDHETNGKDKGKTAEDKSQTFRIDHTAPIFKDISMTRTNQGVQVQAQVHDTMSFIKMIQYSLNGSSWVYIEPSDFIYDSFEETFTLAINNTETKHLRSENTLMIRAVDAYHNVAVHTLYFDWKQSPQELMKADISPIMHSQTPITSSTTTTEVSLN